MFVIIKVAILTKVYHLMFFNTGWDWNALQVILWGTNLKYSKYSCLDSLLNLSGRLLDYAGKYLNYLSSIVS